MLVKKTSPATDLHHMSVWFAATWLSVMGAFDPSATLRDAPSDLDSNTVFYQGQEHSYVLPAPEGFAMVVEDAAWDGYSCAFVPESSTYDTADVTVGVTIYSLSTQSPLRKFGSLLAEDTARIRAHYGRGLTIWPVDSMRIAGGKTVPTFYFNDPSRFIPTVMAAYVNGTTEMIILDLHIRETFLRFEAEKIFDKCLAGLKILKRPKSEED